MRTLIAVSLIAATALPADDSPLSVKPGLFRHDIKGTLGLPEIQGATQVVFRASEDTYKYSHHPNFAVFRDRLYLMWSSGKEGENQNGQRIVYRSTTDGESWTPLSVVAEDPDGSGPLHGVAAGFLVRDGKLIAYYSGAYEEKPLHPASTLFARVSSDGSSWGEQIELAKGFFNQPPRELPGGRIVFGGHSDAPQPRILFTDSRDPLKGWKEASIPAISEYKVQFVEPTSYRRPDGSLVMLFRANRESLWLWASTSKDNGATWSKAVQTGMPDAVSKMAAGSLPNGDIYIINNPGQQLGRIPLAISLSREGRTFDRAFAIRSEDTKARFDGRAKGHGYQYPGAVVWKGALWVAYSVNKEDIEVSRIPVGSLSR